MTRLKIVFGTLFGAGLLPKAPGTWGSFFSLPLIFAASFYFPGYGIFVFIIAACLLSVWSAPAAVEKYGEDPPQFVMDECAGQAVVFLFTGFYSVSFTEVYTLIAGFILFRVFDILKPFGIDYIQKLPGKFGILGDDLLAGFYALICLELLKRIPAFLY